MPKADKVGIGTRVTLEIGDQILMWRIVGHDESDAGSNRVAYSAPLARTLLGAEVGDEVVLPGSTTATVTRIDAED
ncbi:MAG: GreA/GreB family elongation factor [Allosphingosinicella sp.]